MALVPKHSRVEAHSGSADSCRLCKRMLCIRLVAQADTFSVVEITYPAAGNATGWPVVQPDKLGIRAEHIYTTARCRAAPEGGVHIVYQPGHEEGVLCIG